MCSILILLLPAPVGWIGLKLHTVDLKSDETDDGTPGGRYATAIVPSLSTCDGHTTGHWPVALFKRWDRRRDNVKLPVVMGCW